MRLFKSKFVRDGGRLRRRWRDSPLRRISATVIKADALNAFQKELLRNFNEDAGLMSLGEGVGQDIDSAGRAALRLLKADIGMATLQSEVDLLNADRPNLVGSVRLPTLKDGEVIRMVEAETPTSVNRNRLCDAASASSADIALREFVISQTDLLRPDPAISLSARVARALRRLLRRNWPWSRNAR